MKKRLLIPGLVLTILAGILLPAMVSAADTGTVTCTVSSMLVSVTVTDGTVSYGSVALSGTKNTREYSYSTNKNGMATADPQTITNTDTAAETFTINSSDAIGSSRNWTLATSPGSNAYAHQFSVNDGSSWTSLTTAYQTLATNIASNGTQKFDLQILMPTSTTDYGSHTITVTILATAT